MGGASSSTVEQDEGGSVFAVSYYCYLFVAVRRECHRAPPLYWYSSRPQNLFLTISLTLNLSILWHWP